MADALSDLLIKMDVDSAKFRAEIDKATEKLKDLETAVDKAGEKSEKGFKLELGELAIEGATKAYEHLKESIERVSEAEHQALIESERLGLSVEEVGRLNFAFIEAGSSGGVLERALTTLQQRAESGEAHFKSLGIAIRDQSGHLKEDDTLLHEVADKIERATSHSERLAIATAAFGKKLAAEVLPALQDGSRGLDEAAEKSDRLGITISETSAKLGKDFKVALEEAQGAMAGHTRQIVDEFEPALTKLLRLFATFEALRSKASFGIKFGLAIELQEAQERMDLIKQAGESLGNDFRWTSVSAKDWKSMEESAKRVKEAATSGEQAAYLAHIAELKAQIAKDIVAETAAEAAKKYMYEGELSDQTKQLAIQEQLAKYSKMRTDEERALVDQINASNEARGRGFFAQELEKAKHAQEQLNTGTEKWARTLGTQVVGAVKILVTDLIKGGNVLQDLGQFALDLGIKLAEDAARAALIAGIESALGIATGGFSGAFFKIFGGSSGGTASRSGVQSFASGGEVKFGVPGRDSVPAWLMPDEVVLNPEQSKAYKSGQGGGGGGSLTVVAPIQTLIPDVTSIQTSVQRALIPALMQILQTGQGDRIFRKHVQRWAQ